MERWSIEWERTSASTADKFSCRTRRRPHGLGVYFEWSYLDTGLLTPILFGEIGILLVDLRFEYGILPEGGVRQEAF